ncbi:MAG: hypothetical protein RJB66_84 [Pseudomonadota bacterium]
MVFVGLHSFKQGFAMAVLSLFVLSWSLDGLATGALSSQRLPILQGATSSTTVQLAVLRSSDRNLRYQLADSLGALFEPISIKVKTRVTSAWVVDQLAYQGLPEGRELVFRVLSAEGKPLDARLLRTLNPRAPHLKIALASCMADDPQFYSAPIWRSLEGQKPDLIFFLGDNVYASIKTPVNPAELWERYRQTRMALDFFYFERLIPVFATWDDHDFGLNNGDRRYPFVREAQDVFRDFFPQEEIFGILQKGPGISQSLLLYGKQFVFMDDRSFRDAPMGESMWGSEQEAWLSTILKTAKQPVWVINGSQMFGQYGPSESLERDFPSHFSRFVGDLSRSSQSFTLVSGDIHSSEVLQLPVKLVGRRALEITSSSMHAKHSSLRELPPSPRRLAGYHGDNFVIVHFEPDPTQNSFYLEAFGRRNQKVFEYLY